MNGKSRLTERVSGLNTLEKATIVISVIAVAFLIVDPLVLGVVRSFDPSTYTFFRSLTHLGRSNWILIPTGAGIIIMAWLRARDSDFRRSVVRGYASQLLIFIFAAIAVSGLSASLIKNVIGRARPKLFDTLGPLEFQPMTFDADFASFPSGHATTAGALAAVLAIVFPKARIPFFVAGAWVASTRFLIGAHYLSDVVAGFIFGAAVVYVLRDRLASRRWLFKFGADGRPVLRARSVLDRAIDKTLGRAKAYLPDQARAMNPGAHPRP